MKSVKPKLCNVHLGENQEEYNTLYSFRKHYNPECEVVCKFELTDEEIAKIVETKTIYYSQLTFGNKFQPMVLTPFEEEVYAPEELQYYDTRVANAKGNQAIVEFKTKCDNCNEFTEHKLTDIINTEDSETNVGVSECSVCSSKKQDFIADLLGNTSPEERTRIVTEEWNKDNSYRPFCGNCLGVDRMEHIEGGWECPNCKAIGMREQENTE
jgi:hypothetical protein